MSPGRGKAKGKSTGKKKESRKRRRHVAANLKDVILCNCIACPDPRLLSQAHGDQVLWRSCDDQGYDITFTVSPFRDTDFRVDPNGTTPSGPIKRDAPYDDYKYTVVGDNGCNQDPVIHIGP